MSVAYYMTSAFTRLYLAPMFHVEHVCTFRLSVYSVVTTMLIMFHVEQPLPFRILTLRPSSVALQLCTFPLLNNAANPIKHLVAFILHPYLFSTSCDTTYFEHLFSCIGHRIVHRGRILNFHSYLYLVHSYPIKLRLTCGHHQGVVIPLGDMPFFLNELFSLSLLLPLL